MPNKVGSLVKFGPWPFGWYFGLVIKTIRHSGFGAYSVSSCDARKNKFVKKLKMWKKIPAKLENIVKSRPRTLSSLFFLDHISNQSTVNTEFEAKMSFHFKLWHMTLIDFWESTEENWLNLMEKQVRSKPKQAPKKSNFSFHFSINPCYSLTIEPIRPIVGMTV